MQEDAPATSSFSRCCRRHWRVAIPALLAAVALSAASTIRILRPHQVHPSARSNTIFCKRSLEALSVARRHPYAAGGRRIFRSLCHPAAAAAPSVQAERIHDSHVVIASPLDGTTTDVSCNFLAGRFPAPVLLLPAIATDGKHAACCCLPAGCCSLVLSPLPCAIAGFKMDTSVLEEMAEIGGWQLAPNWQNNTSCCICCRCRYCTCRRASVACCGRRGSTLWHHVMRPSTFVGSQ